MSCLPLLQGAIPGEVADEVIVEQVINLDEPIASENLSSEFKIQFPSKDPTAEFSTELIPLIGGAVVSFPVDGLKLEIDPKINKILTRELDQLSNLKLNCSLKSLSDLYINVNKIFYDLARKDYKVLSNRSSAPILYISRVMEDDIVTSSEDPNFIPPLRKICELRYLPFESFKELFKNLKLAKGYVTGQAEDRPFSEMIGISGRKFSVLSSYLDKEQVEESEITDLLLEFFPIANIPSQALNGSFSKFDIGGYYTIINNTIYLKMPDLSGRDSSGDVESGFISPNDLLYIEVIVNATQSKIPLKFINPVFANFNSSSVIPDDFPAKDDFFEVKINIVNESVSQYKLYLSPVITGPGLSTEDYPYSINKKPKFMRGYNSSIEIFSTNPLTKGIEANRDPIVSYEENKENIDASNLAAKKYFSNKIWERYSSGDKDFAFISYKLTADQQAVVNSKDNRFLLSSLDPYVFYGIKNRPDIMMNPESGFVDSKNNNKYQSLKSYGKIDILSSIMPKINKNIPAAWIDADLSIDDEGFYVAKIPFEDVEGIELGSIANEIRYAAYISDSYGQTTKVSGPLINLSIPKPIIEQVVPNGYDESSAITFDTTEVITINIVGEDLEQVRKIKLRPSSSGNELIIDLDEGIFEFINSELLRINIQPGFLLQNFPEVTQKYYISVIDKKGRRSQEDSIYITQYSDESRPRGSAELVNFEKDEFFSSYFGQDPIVGIPIFDNEIDNALIKIDSKNKVFRKSAQLFIYFALVAGVADSEEDKDAKEKLFHFSFPDRNFETTLDDGSRIYVPVDIFSIIGNSPAEDFFRITNKKAAFKFPGKEYSKYNFSILNGLKQGYLLITNQPINSFSKDSFKNIESLKNNYNFKYSYIKLGDGITPAFISPYSIVDIAVKDINGVSSTFAKTKYDNSIYSEDFQEDFSVKEINTNGKVKKLLLIASGIDQKNISGKYNFFFDGKKINEKISKDPVAVTGGKIAFEFKNISPLNSGIIPINLEVKNTPFISKYKPSNYAKKASFIIGSRPGATKIYSVGEDSSIIMRDLFGSNVYMYSNFSDFYNLVNDKNDSGSSVSIIAPSTYNQENFVDGIYPDNLNDGIIFNESLTTINKYYFFNPIEVSSTSNFIMRDELGNDLNISRSGTKISKGLFRYSLSLAGGSTFLPQYYIRYEHPDGSEFYLLFLTTYNSGFSNIKCDVPVVRKLAKLGEEFKDFTSDVAFVTGNVYRFLVDNVANFFSIVINGVSLKPNSPPVYDLDLDGFVAEVTITDDVSSGNDSSVTIGASSSNEERNRAGFALGEQFVNEISEINENCEEFIDGLPTNELFEKIKDFALKLLSFKLDLPLPAKTVINSFCDLSFDLTKELKYALNGFRTLMIPVQVIFCIIDVLCSLLNPAKLVRAIIRLFECLYDLICLLPTISVPVMFFQLTLHLLELLKCVFDKIGLTIRAINDIVAALKRAFATPIDYTAAKALEETLEQYLKDIDLDLRFLDPIVSILDIFLQLLQLVFRFPCKVSPISEDESDVACGLDGTMIAGLITGIVAPNSTIIPQFLLPVAQAYSIDSNGSMDSSLDPAIATLVATDDGTGYYSSLNVDDDSLRANSDFDFNITFAPCYTKADRKGRKSKKVQFEFKYQANRNSSNIDPNQTADAPFALFNNIGGTNLTIGNIGNIFSPIDGESFLDINADDKVASVKPLTLKFEIPRNEVNPDTGILEQVGVDIVTRTFDNVPMMSVIDDELNVYFIEKDGIEYNATGFVDRITARIINQTSVPKHKFTKEDVEIDSEQVNLYDFPQLYFFDMRQIASDLQQYCITTSINSFPLEENNTEDILEIVQSSLVCINNWRNYISSITNGIRSQQQSNSSSVEGIDLEAFNSSNQELVECLDNGITDICKYVINSLNTSFKVVEDNSFIPKKDYVDGLLPDSILEGFNPSGPSFTGAREYAAGIGDNAIINSGAEATLEIIPRDVYDEEILGDISGRISIEIISDETGSAQLVLDSAGKYITRINNTYIAKLTSSGSGEVRVKAQVCDRTIQALIYQEVQSQLPPEVVNDPGCVPGSDTQTIIPPPSIGSISKVDRILSIYFRERIVTSADLSKANLSDEAFTQPQEFGTSLEN